MPSGTGGLYLAGNKKSNRNRTIYNKDIPNRIKKNTSIEKLLKSFGRKYFLLLLYTCHLEGLVYGLIVVAMRAASK